MAEENHQTAETFHSVETDAAPSTEYVNLASLDIGSECTVETESKLGRKKFVSDIDAVLEKEENELCSQVKDDNASTEQQIDPHEKETDRNLECGLGSLNLKETLTIPEVTVAVDEDHGKSLGLVHLDTDGDSLLHTAVISLKTELALHLIMIMTSLELPLDIANRLQQTALHLAVLTGLVDVVRALVVAGASPFARDHQLRTPMSIACEKDNMIILREIIQNVNWNMKENDFISKLLNPSTRALNLPNADGERCLHIAVRYNNVEMAKELLDNGADPNLPDRRSGRTPLHVAADLGHVEITKLLISAENIDINQRTYKWETALEIAHMRERPEVVAVLKPLSFPMKKRKSKNDIATG